MKTQQDLYERLSEEKKRLYDHIETHNIHIHLYVQDGEIYAEIDDYTDGGVNMIIDIMPFSLYELKSYIDDFDIDNEIDLHRMDEDYRKHFRISESVRDFEKWLNDWRAIIKVFEKKEQQIEKLKDKLSSLKSKLFEAQSAENAVFERIGFGSGMRRTKVSVSTRKSDAIRERIKKCQQQIDDLIK